MNDIIFLSVCSGLLIIYHIFAYSTIFLAGNKYRIQLNKDILNGNIWLHRHKHSYDPSHVVLAVQTLRNAAIVGIFVGG